MTVEKIRIQPSNWETRFAEHLKPLFDKCYEITQDPEELFRLAWLSGMQRAAEIESEHHEWKGRRKGAKTSD